MPPVNGLTVNCCRSTKQSQQAASGYEEAIKRLWQSLQDMGAKITDHAVYRIDYAMDFQTPGFELSANQFVCHSHTKVAPHWSEEQSKNNTQQPSAVIRGRKLESVTIGKMPGRQIIVYD